MKLYLKLLTLATNADQRKRRQIRISVPTLFWSNSESDVMKGTRRTKRSYKCAVHRKVVKWEIPESHPAALRMERVATNAFGKPLAPSTAVPGHHSLPWGPRRFDWRARSPLASSSLAFRGDWEPPRSLNPTVSHSSLFQKGIAGTSWRIPNREDRCLDHDAPRRPTS